ncbi:MAG: N-formylglutamate deformylase [Xanthomonadales bacterium]|nr:N-formylglutamate deformylase [Xanthomonadales bacterium]
MNEISVQESDSPLIISVPHAGTQIPADIKDRMRPESLFLPDTDWFVDKLYGWARVEHASLVSTAWSRYVIDVNRPPDDSPMYERPGTGLVPLETFAGDPIYRQGRAPEASEISQRLEAYWKPFHRALDEQINRVREEHGFGVLLDGHSIRSVLPRLFDGELPHLNLGSHGGASADQSLVDLACGVLNESDFDTIRDGRFKGGYITRHYGRPQEGVHAVQLEIAQRAYMAEFPPHWDVARAKPLIRVLKRLVAALETWRPNVSADQSPNRSFD